MSAEIAPGHYPEMTAHAYMSSAGISKTQLDVIASPNCPKHYWGKYIDPNRKSSPRTAAQVLGDAIDKAILEPDMIERDFVVIPDDAPRKPSISQVEAKKPSLETKGAIDYWNAFTAENKTKIILSADDMATVIACRDAVHLSPNARGLLSGGAAQQCYYAIDKATGMLIKTRLDYEIIERAGMIIDIKSTTSSSPGGFGKSAQKYRYYVQGWFNPHVVESLYGPGIVQDFAFITVEKEPPYAVGIHMMEADDFADGRSDGRRDLEQLRICYEAHAAGNPNAWPDYSQKPNGLMRSNYDKQRPPAPLFDILPA